MYTEEGLKESLDYFDERIEEAKEYKKIGEAIKKLTETEEWKIAIEQGYFEKEANRLVKGVLNTNNILKRENFQNMLDMLMAVRYFKEYVEYMQYLAAKADEQIDDLKKEKESFAKDYEEAMKKQDEVVDSEVVGGE